jgi:Ecdysteroid kinase-like family
MTPLSYPTQPEQLTTGWLTTALRADGAITTSTVTHIEQTPVGVGAGMLGSLVKIDLTYDHAEAGAPSSVVAKFATPIIGNRAVAMAFRLYEREIGFYRQVAPSVDVAAPRSFAGEIDTSNGDSVLLIEDLSAYRTGDQVAGCTAAEAKTIIDAIVPLHAAYWGHAEDMPLECVPHIDSDSQIAGITGGCHYGWDPAMERFGHVIAPEIKAVREQFLAAVPELHRMMGRCTQTVIHGDVRLDNLMFGTSPEHPDVILIDWSMTISNGLHDVAYLVSQNVTTEERRAHELELVAHHHAGLVARGVTGYTLDQAWSDYKTAILYLFCYGVVIGGTLDPSNERGAAFMEKLLERSSHAVMDHHLLDLLSTIAG